MISALRQRQGFKSSLQTQPTPPAPTFRLLERFCGNAGPLWSQFEQKLLTSGDTHDGLTPLVYAFNPGHYAFLTASADRLFSSEAMDDLMLSLRKWSREEVGAAHVSTPQVRVFINGCRRGLFCDATEAEWHWLLPLTPAARKGAGRIQLGHRIAQGDGARLLIERTFSFEPEFNQLLVHAANDPYGVELGKPAASPLEAFVFLDGYMW